MKTNSIAEVKRTKISIIGSEEHSLSPGRVLWDIRESEHEKLKAFLSASVAPFQSTILDRGYAVPHLENPLLFLPSPLNSSFKSQLKCYFFADVLPTFPDSIML